MTRRHERKACSKESKAKERRRQVPVDHGCAISALNGLLPDSFCNFCLSLISDFFH